MSELKNRVTNEDGSLKSWQEVVEADEFYEKWANQYDRETLKQMEKEDERKAKSLEAS